MVTSKAVMDIIKGIIERRYRSLAVGILGKDALTRAQINELRENGITVADKPSMIELAYYHNFLNPHGTKGPNSLEDMASQQSEGKPRGPAHTYAEQHASDAMRISIDKLKQDVTTRILSLIQENNQNFKFSTMKNASQTEEVQKLIKESTLSKLKQRLRDTSGDVNRDWQRVAITETSNAIGIGSVDRILSQNQEKNADDVYVYRIVVQDQALCKYCRQFYLDNDGSPKLYRLSTLVGNGSNYGKKAADWEPVVGATHPNERCSQVIELKRGWRLLPGGRQEYMGSEGWDDYIVEKLTA